jgi:hypothetical protein
LRKGREGRILGHMRGKKLISGLMLVVLSITMAAPAWAGPCRCPHMQQAQKQKELPPCHKAKADKETPKKSCCENCACKIAPAPATFLLPQPESAPSAYSTVTYSLSSAHFFAERILAPPVSPPNA